MAEKISFSISENRDKVLAAMSESQDVLFKDIKVGGVDCFIVHCDGMINKDMLGATVLNILAFKNEETTPQKVYSYIFKESTILPDIKETDDFDEALYFMMSGFAMIFIDEIGKAIAIGVQGMPGRSVAPPVGENNIRGAGEGFVENFKINSAMIRKRLRSRNLVFESVVVGEYSNTAVTLVYLGDKVNKNLLEDIKEKLGRIDKDIIVDSGYITAQITDNKKSFFPTVGYTERPDTAAAKINEGRIVLVVDGSPFVLVLPYIFIENFQNIDDYTRKPYYGTFLRWIKYISAVVSVFLPGFYIATVIYNPEYIPKDLIENIVTTGATTPFPLLLEAMFVWFLFEVLIEAGLRLPKNIGHAIGIVGALVVGETAVSAGIISAPMVIILAFTAISAFVVPFLYTQVIFLRFLNILVGGVFGTLGLIFSAVGLISLLVCTSSFGVPYFAPISPFSKKGLGDSLFVRSSGKRNIKSIYDLPGASDEK